MTGIHLLTLGRLALLSGGDAVLRSRPKELALLAYLALTPHRAISRLELIRVFWNNGSERRARHSLSQSLHSLRRILPGLTMPSSREELVIAPGHIETDVTTFRSAISRGDLERAAGCYVGRFLSRTRIPASRAFYSWKEELDVELQIEANRVFCQLAIETSRSGDILRSANFARRALAIDPLQEEMRSILAEVANLPAVCANARRPPMSSSSPASVPAVIQATVESMPFVGRNAELDIAARQRDIVRELGLRTLIVTGGQGVGKSRFCQQVLRRAAISGSRILQSQCTYGAANLPFAAIGTALADGLTENDVLSLREPWRTAVVRMAPELAPASDRLPTTFFSEALAPLAGRRVIFEAVSRLLESVSTDAPVALHIDDVQWADESTIRLLDYLVARPSRLKIFVIISGNVSSRHSGEERATLDHLLLSNATHLHLEDLDLATVRALVARTLGMFENVDGRDEVLELFRVTGGNPYLLTELITAVARGEAHLSTIIESPARAIALAERFMARRIPAAGTRERRVLEAVSVLGLHATAQNVARLTRCSLATATSSLDSHVRAGLLVTDGQVLAFRHELLREALCADLGPVTVRSLHGQAAKILAKQTGVPASAIARHWAAAGNRQKAHEHFMLAAEEARRLCGVSEEESLLREALSLAPSAHAAILAKRRLAQHYSFVGRLGAAEQTLADIRASTWPLSSEERFFVDAYMFGIAIRKGSIDDRSISEMYGSLLNGCDEHQGSDATFEVLWNRVYSLYNNNDIRSSLPAAARLVRWARDSDDPLRAVQALVLASQVTVESSDHEGGDALLAEAYERADAEGNPSALTFALGARAAGRLSRGHLVEALDDFDRTREAALQNGLWYSWIGIVNNFGVALLENGSFELAVQMFKHALSISALEESADAGFPTVNLAVAHFEMRDFRSVRAIAHEAIRAPALASCRPNVAMAMGLLGLAELEEGRPHQAQGWNIACQEYRPEDPGRLVLDMSYPESLNARILALDGRRAEAIERLRAVVAAYEGRDVFCRNRLRLELARQLVPVDRAEAESHARAVKAFGEESGARPLVRKARNLLYRMGRPVRGER